MRELSDIVEAATWRFLNLEWPNRCQHEPNGYSSFPDFSIDDKIAVECTRLVKNVATEDCVINLTKETYSFIDSLENAIGDLGPMGSSKTYFLCLDIAVSAYREPRVSKKQLVEFLRKTDPITYIYPSAEAHLDCGIGVSFVESKRFLGNRFALGAWMGPDSSGWVVDDILEQSLEAIARKSDKVRKSQFEFEEYFLAVGSGLTTTSLKESDIDFLRKAMANQDIWSGLIIVNTLVPEESILIRL